TLLVALLMSVTCIFGLTACNDGGSVRDLDDIVKSGKITVATNAEFPPFENKEGENYVGIDIDIAQAIADYLDVELVINNMAFESVVTSVQKGQSDLALAALTINETRLNAIDFSDDYFGAAQYVVVKADDTTFDACTTKEDVDTILGTLSGIAGAQSGTTGYYYIKGSSAFEFNGFSNLEARGYDTPSEAAMAVANNQIKLAIVDDEVANQIVAANSNVKAIQIALSTEKYGIGINKSNKGLAFVVNKVLAQLKESGELNAIIERHTAAAAE
ncbi:MAG: transporter substrate-binding domain-containing protein, partial [Clostridia bacterium]|nr:transporter substrate-binding domain-containing protein [Clostridia bacterium]